MGDSVELVLTRGLPASGKTTYASKWVRESETTRARVNRDDLREAMFGRPAPLPGELEQAVTVAQHASVEALLLSGTSVIVDDMHLRQRYITEWENIADRVGATLSVVDIATPVEECMRRDYERWVTGGRRVGDDFIQDMGRRFGKLKPYTPRVTPASTLYEPDVTKLGAWIVDVDGTLALMGDRSPYDHARVCEDTVHSPVCEIARSLHKAGYAIVIASGRVRASQAMTETWLQNNRIPYDAIVMRADGDSRKDSIVKRELFEEHIAPHWNVVGVLDDRNQVVDMWRSLGLMCAQVAPGNF